MSSPHSALSKTIQCIRIALLIFALIAISALAICRASFPMKSGNRILPGLEKSVRVDRDERSIPLIEAKSRADLSRVLGFLHAQERFFQMDVLRRVSSGELSELFGSSTLFLDQRLRPFQLREVARQIVSQLPPKERSWLNAYTEGVNEGLRTLTSSPFEYWLLRGHAQSWQAEDSFLVCYNLFSALQDFCGDLTRNRETLYANIPLKVACYFTENGSRWEARIDNSRDELLPIPGKEHFAYLANWRNHQMRPSAKNVANATPRISDAMGSNCWAITSDLTDGKGAMIACDMHLRLGAPNIWYRASLSYLDELDKTIRLHGATIPGVPALIMGSNQHIGWGFTNAQLNTTDLMRIERIGEDHYMGPDGPLPLKIRREVIKVRGGPDFVQQQIHSHWGPLAKDGEHGHFNAMHWVGRDWRSLDLSLIRLERARDVQEGVQIATAMRTPVLNFFVADDKGQIGWALSGSMPKRNYSAQRVINSTKNGWQRLMLPEEMPRVIASKNGRLWNANHTMLNATKWGYLGKENMLNPIRGYQIRADLFSRSKHTFDDMHDLQLEVRAPFLKRWQELLLNILVKATDENRADSDLEAVGSDARRAVGSDAPRAPGKGPRDEKRKELLAACRLWDGRCADRSTGYALIRQFRDQISMRVLSRFLAPCFAADPLFSPHCFESEESIWQLVSERPAHLADPTIGSWDGEFLKAIDEVIDYFSKKYPRQRLDQISWGDEQTLRIQHPLAKAIGWLSRAINLPSSHLGGDKLVPKVLCDVFGASQRMVLYPGNEVMSSFEMPGGQSGNPLSKHYRDQHKNWTRGKKETLLPGKSVDQLHFSPSPVN